MSRRDEPAFPRLERLTERQKTGGLMADAEYRSTGLTIREEAVLRAMQGLCANGELYKELLKIEIDRRLKIIKESAILIGDAQLDAMEKKS